MVVIICSLSNACKQQSDIEDLSHRIDSLSLVKSDKVKLPLDSITSISARVLNMRIEEGVEILSFLQGSNIHQYDFKKRAKISTLMLDEQSQGLGRVWGFGIKNEDTIVVASRYKISVLDSKGKSRQYFQIQRRYNEKKLNESICSFGNENLVFIDKSIYSMTIPQVNIGNDINIGKRLLKQVNNIAFSWDLENDTFQYFLSFPEKLVSNHYSAFFREKGSQTYNSRNETLIYSFGASDSLYVYDKFGNFTGQHLATSRLYPEIPSATANIYSDQRYRVEFAYTTPRYSHVVYDKYRNLYYRIIQHPLTDQEFLNNDWTPESGVIILDKKFRIVGEVNHLGKDLDVTNPFVVQDGLVFLNRFPEDEDYMELEVFEIQKL